MPRKVGICYEGVSCTDQRNDLQLCTLRTHLEAIVSKLSFMAEFPDCVPVILTHLNHRKPTQMPLVIRNDAQPHPSPIARTSARHRSSP